jgi:hypothetical protein
VFSELNDSGEAVVISGTVIGCATKVVTSSICFVSAIAVVWAEVILVLAREIISQEDMLLESVYFVYPARYKQLVFHF